MDGYLQNLFKNVLLIFPITFNKQLNRQKISSGYSINLCNMHYISPINIRFLQIFYLIYKFTINSLLLNFYNFSCFGRN